MNKKNLPVKRKNSVVHKKNYYPSNRNNYYPANPKNGPDNMFKGNIVNNMNFGDVGDSRSGYVKREMIMIDRYGNKKMARETQFFNSGKGIHVRVRE